MPEIIGYNLRFSFAEPRVLEAQSSYRDPSAATHRGFYQDNLFFQLMGHKNWSAIGLTHRHHKEIVLTDFTFRRYAKPFPDEPQLLEAASFDMYSWLIQVGLEDEAPNMVELQKGTSEGWGERQDLTIEAMVVFSGLVQLRALESRDFE